MELSAAEFAEVREALLGPQSDAIVDAVFAIATGSAAGLAPQAEAFVRQAGWVEGDPPKLTKRGYLVSDSIRERVFWLGRDRKLPCEGMVPHLSAAYYAGKSILEVGAGSGTHLMSLGAVTDRAVGLDPVPIYRQLAEIFCEKDALRPVDIRTGLAEALPFEDASFEMVLCITAHQYMELKPALAEMVRVLKPGGELQIIGGHLASFAAEGLKPVLRGSPRAAKDYAVTIANTLSYSLVKKRIVGGGKKGTTGYPIYPIASTMNRMLKGCGLEPLHAVARAYPELCYSYRKPE